MSASWQKTTDSKVEILSKVFRLPSLREYCLQDVYTAEKIETLCEADVPLQAKIVP